MDIQLDVPTMLPAGSLDEEGLISSAYRLLAGNIVGTLCHKL